MNCDKKAFKTYAQGRKTLREWRRLARRSNFDRAHVYEADCAEHKGKFHIGLVHDRINRRVKRAHTALSLEDARVRAQLLDLDDVFSKQTQRIVGKLSRMERRLQAHLAVDNEGPVTRHFTNQASSGDEFDVEHRK